MYMKYMIAIDVKSGGCRRTKRRTPPHQEDVMSHSPPQAIYVAGRRRKAATDELIDVVDPTTEELLARVPRCSPADADLAVEAAHAAQEDWAQVPQSERIGAVGALLKALEARADRLTEAVVDDVGTPLRIADKLQTHLPLAAVTGFLDAAQGIEDPVRIGNSTVHRSPVGVVAAITPVELLPARRRRRRSRPPARRVQPAERSGPGGRRRARGPCRYGGRAYRFTSANGTAGIVSSTTWTSASRYRPSSRRATARTMPPATAADTRSTTEVTSM